MPEPWRSRTAPLGRPAGVDDVLGVAPKRPKAREQAASTRAGAGDVRVAARVLERTGRDEREGTAGARAHGGVDGPLADDDSRDAAVVDHVRELVRRRLEARVHDAGAGSQGREPGDHVVDGVLGGERDRPAPADAQAREEVGDGIDRGGGVSVGQAA